MPKPPVPRLTVITLGVADMRQSIAFYEALGFARKMRVTGEAVAFFDTGATVIGLFPWDQLAQDATLPDQPRPPAFRGMTLAWNCGSAEEVDEVLAPMPVTLRVRRQAPGCGLIIHAPAPGSAEAHPPDAWQ